MTQVKVGSKDRLSTARCIRMDEVRQQCGVRVDVPWLLHEQGRDGSIGRSGDRVSRSLGTPVLNCKVTASADGLFAARLPNTNCKKVTHSRATGTHAHTTHNLSYCTTVCVCVCFVI